MCEWACVLCGRCIPNGWVGKATNLINICMKLEHSSMETIWMIQKAAAMGNWWWAASSWQCACSCITGSQSLWWLSPLRSSDKPRTFSLGSYGRLNYWPRFLLLPLCKPFTMHLCKFSHSRITIFPWIFTSELAMWLALTSRIKQKWQSTCFV